MEHAPESASPGRRSLRVLMYSHDSYGLGHFRRTLTLAAHLSEALPGASVLVATGSPCCSHFPLPPRVDVLKLPSVTKDEAGRYVSRSLPCSPLSLLRLRGRILLETFRAFRPSLLVVDHQIVGLRGELAAVLEESSAAGTATILGLRDVIDDPTTVAREWARPEVRAALQSGYDRVCIYGCPSVFDPRVEYPMPAEVIPRVEFLGYVVREVPRMRLRALPPERPSVLVTVGGGQDGASRLSSYLDGLALKTPFWDTTLLLGPLLDPAAGRRLRQRARLLGRVAVHAFRTDLPQQLAESDAVVGMAGYNTTAEILASGVPAVLMPRTHPRREQQIRAERLAALGLVDVLSSPTPETLRGAVERALSRRRGSGAVSLPLEGARALGDVARELLQLSPRRAAALSA